ncbi:MAG: hypothetical protein H6709_11245 [Kofleriaceae bacterium]|nr:hypothetical protein [Myxococcales bacterium]MCB9563787.1 hypothetical protein [Kofleriaceae bacterium]MCB9572650.1 hypothetical protein [Kofleriaceae bacterium]
MIRIELLEVHFDVVGDDEQQFVRLFEKYVNEWSRRQQAQRGRHAALEADRVVGDRHYGGDR